MAIRTREEIMDAVRARIGDDTSDEAIAFVEDISDTLNSMSADDGENWKEKYEENDRNWRQKYRDRFYNTDTPKDEEDDEGDKAQYRSYEDLFKKED
nr:MAG TPA: hypothetical protein [Caudoviricetes sp.]